MIAPGDSQVLLNELDQTSLTGAGRLNGAPYKLLATWKSPFLGNAILTGRLVLSANQTHPSILPISQVVGAHATGSLGFHGFS
jgi:hypothetical protein